MQVRGAFAGVFNPSCNPMTHQLGDARVCLPSNLDTPLEAFMSFPNQRCASTIQLSNYLVATCIEVLMKLHYDADNGQFQLHTVARDSSSYGNHLALQSPPTPQEAVLKPPGSAPVLQSTALSFRNNHAINDEMTTMPEG
eukprot:358375-Chlamydomonas_euryale.AAC.13